MISSKRVPPELVAIFIFELDFRGFPLTPAHTTPELGCWSNCVKGESVRGESVRGESVRGESVS